MVLLSGVLLVGWGSILRQNWVAGVSMVVPAVMVCLFMIMGSHNLWPRFVFFCAGFAILMGVHGIILVAELLPTRFLPSGGPRMARWSAVTAFAALLGMSVAMIPRNYSLPKQDYTGARDYVEQQRGQAEIAVAVGLAGMVYERHYAPHWTHVESSEELEAVIRDHRRVWLVYTMPIHVRTYHPDIWAVSNREFETVKVFPGTLGDGTGFVCSAQIAPSAHASPIARLRGD